MKAVEVYIPEVRAIEAYVSLPERPDWYWAITSAVHAQLEQRGFVASYVIGSRAQKWKVKGSR